MKNLCMNNLNLNYVVRVNGVFSICKYLYKYYGVYTIFSSPELK